MALTASRICFSVLLAGRGEKPGFLRGQGRGDSGDEEEERFAVSATAERWQERTRKKGQLGGKSRKRQHKVREMNGQFTCSHYNVLAVKWLHLG